MGSVYCLITAYLTWLSPFSRNTFSLMRSEQAPVAVSYVIRPVLFAERLQSHIELVKKGLVDCCFWSKLYKVNSANN